MNQILIPLSDTDPGMEYSIVSMNSSGSIRQRLLDLGFIEGTRLFCVMKNGRNLRAYQLRSTVIALRRTDSDHILVTPSGNGA